MSKKRQPIKRPVIRPKRGPKPKAVAPKIPKILTAKEQRFIEEYCVDLNATQAAIRAGYSRKSAHDSGYENLRKPVIASSIANYKAELAARTRMTKDDIVAEMENLARFSMANYLRIGQNGDPIIDLSACTRAHLTALSEAETHDYVDGRGDDARDVKKVKIKGTEKRAALMDLAKLRGDITEKSVVDLNVVSDASIVERVRQMSDEQLREYDALTRRQEELLKGKGASA